MGTCVSKQEQNEELEIVALKEAGCDKCFLDKMTRSKTERNGRNLSACLSAVRRYLRGLESGSGWTFVDASIELLKDLQGRGIEFISLTEQIDTTPGGKYSFP